VNRVTFTLTKMAAFSCNGTRNMSESPKIVIVGAGIAGVAAANVLTKAGLTNFVILEATDRIGGRILSIDLGK